MDYSLLLYFLKKVEFRDDESSVTGRHMRMSIIVKKNATG